MGKGDKKASRKADKEQKRAAKGARRRGPEAAYSLAQAAARLGPPDPSLEAALRAAYPDGALASEGALVGYERVLEDGERLCSQALWLLESDDEGLGEAARHAGLGRPLLALTVDVLGRLEGAPSVDEAAAQTPEQVAARGRALRREALDRLALAQKADSALAAALWPLRERPGSAEALASQLHALSAAVRSLPERSPAAQALAACKGLDAAEAEALAVAAEAVREAQRGDRLLLDALGGLGLVLLGDLVRSLRAVARRSRSAEAPAVRSLAPYFAARGEG